MLRGFEGMASSSDRKDDNGEDDNGKDDGAKNSTKRRRVMDDVRM